MRPSDLRRPLLCVALALLFCFAEGATTEVAAQRIGGKKPTESGKGRIGAPLRPAVEEAKPEKKIVVPLNEGYLSLLTNNGASVTLRRGKNSFPFTVKEGNQLSISKLTPGRYQLEIRLNDDYEPLSEAVDIKSRTVVTLDRSLRSKYGTLILSLGQQAAADVGVKLNGEPVEAARRKLGEGRIYVTRVPIGVQELGLGKPGYDLWSQNITVRAGECENLLAVTMNKAAVTLTVKSVPNAEVYLDNEPQGSIQPDGTLLKRELMPGRRLLRVKLAGYETVEGRDSFEQPLELTLDAPALVIDAPLRPVVEDEELDGAADLEITKWLPPKPSGWDFGERSQGLHVGGDQVALLNTTKRPNRRFNQYRDFRLVMEVKLSNGKGAAWVVRAQDEHNYYLFELTTSSSVKRERFLNFYVCQQNACTLRAGYRVTASIEQPAETITIILTATGKTFEHEVETSADGRVGLAPKFTDETFRTGGIGLRTINELEMFVSKFLITKPRQ